MIFCRYCGTAIADDSIFCAKCGRRLGRRTHPGVERVVRTLRLKTPYPYFGLLLISFVVWIVATGRARADYSKIQWKLELDRKIDRPQEDLFQHQLSVVLENTGDVAVAEIPIELVAHVDPAQPADILADFLGRRLLILQGGRLLPLTVVLSDRIEPKAKRRYGFASAVTAKAPLTVTYEVREEGTGRVLASLATEAQ